MKEPQLSAILGNSFIKYICFFNFKDSQPGDVPSVTLKTSVKDAARVMRERKVTAVIIKDQDGYTNIFYINNNIKYKYG